MDIIRLFFFEGLLLLCAYLISSCVSTRAKLPLSFVISLVLLFELYFYFNLFSIPINVINTVLFLLPLALLLFYFLHTRKIKILNSLELELSDQKYVLVFIFLFLIIISIRLSLHPTSAFDTTFRWEFLAKQIFRYQHFSFYPTFNSKDYQFYFFTESIPPLVQFKYLWTYLSAGDINAKYTVPNVLFQFISIAIFLFLLVKEKTDNNTAWQSVLLLFSCGVIVYAIALNQETGMMTLSMAGILYFTQNNIEMNERVVGTGLCASLGALSREYGGIFVIIGLILLLANKTNRAFILRYILICILLVAPWYTRTWVISGNPFYSISIGSLFYVNPVHAMIINLYHEILFNNYSHNILVMVTEKLSDFIIPIILGAGILFKLRKQYAALYLSFLLLIIVWLMAMPKTAGFSYSTRVLGPVCPILIYLFLSLYKDHRIKNYLCICSSMFALVYCIAFPYQINNLSKKLFWESYFVAQDTSSQKREIYNKYKKQNMKILSDDASAFSISEEFENITIVPVWRPDLEFIFDPETSLKVIYKLLHKKGIHYVQFYDYSVNSIFLLESKFYKDMKNWHLLEMSRYWLLYELPTLPDKKEKKL